MRQWLPLKPWKAEQSNAMNIYYTAKDIEELVAKGIQQLELGPNTSLTDFARETAEQLDVTIVEIGADRAGSPTPVPARAAQPAQRAKVDLERAYNKPRGCQPAGQKETSLEFQAGPPLPAADHQGGSAPVNRLVDLMGKIIKRGA